ncbi:hypothetical protein AB0N09_39785 [Streptomyces erythrochromogenes]|uniref:putative adhesin n=1 Tax=Streptomyces erythrochromogenes TaxID=285574 RepID=UPI00344255B8
MKYLLIGHGSLNADPGFTRPDMEWVGITAGTTLQFYADAGQKLAYSVGLRDIRHLVQQMKAPWAPLDHRNVTYNLRLSGDSDSWSQEFRDTKEYGGYTLIRPGIEVADRVQLCSGTPDTCPTRPRQTARGDKHRCEGILGRYGGELHWLACTSVTGVGGAAADAVAAVTAGLQKSVRLGGLHPDWTPPAGWAPDRDFIPVAHYTLLEDAPDGYQAVWSAGGGLFLINAAHEPDLVAYVSSQDYVSGILTLHRTGGPRNVGYIQVDGVPESRRDLVTGALAQASSFPVYFTEAAPEPRPAPVAVTTQDELDAALRTAGGHLVTVMGQNLHVSGAHGAQIRLGSGIHLVVTGDAHLRITADDVAYVSVHGTAHVEAAGNVHVRAQDHARVSADEYARVAATGCTTVTSDSDTVRIWANEHVHVEALPQTVLRTGAEFAGLCWEDLDNLFESRYLDQSDESSRSGQSDDLV